jgi:Family of unknown function (DUF6502)
MEAESQTRIRKAIRVCIRPIAEFLLRAGVSYREFEEASKLAFAEAAIDTFGVRGRPTNNSRVAAMTGMARKEVSRLRGLIESENANEKAATSPAGLVLAGWFSDKEFVGSDGGPRLLNFDDNSTSFATLVRRYAGDVPAGAIRAELKRSGAIEELTDGTLKALHRHFVPHEALDRLSNSVEIILHALASTIAHNSNPTRTGAGRIERFVFSDSLTVKAVPEFRLEARRRAQDLLVDLDDWLAARDDRAGESEERKADFRVGVGVFYYEGPSNPASKDG